MATQFRLHAPDRVQCALEFEECAGRSDDKGDAAEHGRQDPCPSLAGPLEKTLHGARTLAADQVIELAHDFPAHGLGAEDHAPDCGGDEENWRDRKQRVICERRAEAKCIVIPPRPECRGKHFQNWRRAHRINPPASLWRRVLARWSIVTYNFPPMKPWILMNLAELAVQSWSGVACPERHRRRERSLLPMLWLSTIFG